MSCKVGPSSRCAWTSARYTVLAEEMKLTNPAPRFPLTAAAICLLVLMCFSYEARGDGTAEEDLAPGVKLRIESCGYERTPIEAVDDDDSASGDDDDSADSTP